MSDSMRDMQVVILCGGQGTRIRAVAEDKPKPMVDIGGQPILWHIMKYYYSFGVRRFVLALGHQGHVIVDYFMNYRLRQHDVTLSTSGQFALKHHVQADASVEDWEVTLVNTGNETMTGGRIKRAARYVDGDCFFATYGDGLSTIDLRRLLQFHRAHGRMATLTGVRQPTTFGIVEAGENGTINAFREKPTLEGYINGGFFVFNRDIANTIGGDDSVLEEEPFRAMLLHNELAMFKHEGFWQCMDHFKDYATLNKMWAGGKAPWKVW